MDEVKTGTIADVVDIAQTPPPIPPDLIDRESSVKTIDRTFQQGVEIVFLEGPEGIGKTTLARQFLEKNRSNTLSIFLRSIGSHSLNLQSVLSDVCNQAYWLVEGVRLPEVTDVDQSFLNQLFHRLQRRAIAKRSTYHVVIDGLNALIPEHSYIRDAILRIFPFGSRTFRFLITGEASSILGDKAHQFLHKSYPVDGFSHFELKQYLAPFALDVERLNEIQRVTDGVPAKLASVKRLLQLGKDPTEVTAKFDASLTEFFDIEWSQVEGNLDSTLQLVLAVLAFDEKEWSLPDLALLARTEEAALRSKLKSLTFIIFEPDNKVHYVSDAFKRYASERRLRSSKSAALDKIIDHLLIDPESSDALVSLPTYLERAGRDDEILKYLSPDHLDKLLAKTKTLATVFRNVDVGITVARRLKVDEDYAALILDKSLLSDLSTVDTWKDEVNALLAIGKYEDAVSIATAETLSEDQLQLLCIVSRWKKENSEQPDAWFSQKINELYKKLDPVALGYERAIDIAGDLFSISPDSAIDLVTRAAGTPRCQNSCRLFC